MTRQQLRDVARARYQAYRLAEMRRLMKGGERFDAFRQFGYLRGYGMLVADQYFSEDELNADVYTLNQGAHNFA